MRRFTSAIQLPSREIEIELKKLRRIKDETQANELICQGRVLLAVIAKQENILSSTEISPGTIRKKKTYKTHWRGEQRIHLTNIFHVSQIDIAAESEGRQKESADGFYDFKRSEPRWQKPDTIRCARTGFTENLKCYWDTKEEWQSLFAAYSAWRTAKAVRGW